MLKNKVKKIKKYCDCTSWIDFETVRYDCIQLDRGSDMRQKKVAKLSVSEVQ